MCHQTQLSLYGSFPQDSGPRRVSCPLWNKAVPSPELKIRARKNITFARGTLPSAIKTPHFDRYSAKLSTSISTAPPKPSPASHGVGFARRSLPPPSALLQPLAYRARRAGLPSPAAHFRRRLRNQIPAAVGVACYHSDPSGCTLL